MGEVQSAVNNAAAEATAAVLGDVEIFNDTDEIVYLYAPHLSPARARTLDINRYTPKVWAPG